MRRMKLVIAALVVMVAALAACAGPAMAWGNGVNEGRGFNHNFNNGGLILSNGNLGGLGNFGFGGFNDLGFGCGFTFGCNTGFIF